MKNSVTPEEGTVKKHRAPELPTADFSQLVIQRALCVMEPRERPVIQLYFDANNNRRETILLPEHRAIVRKYEKVHAAAERYLKHRGEKGRADHRVHTTVEDIDKIVGLTRFQKALLSEIASQEACWKGNMLLAIQFRVSIDAIKFHLSSLVKGGWVSASWNDTRTVRHLVLGEHLRLLSVTANSHREKLTDTVRNPHGPSEKPSRTQRETLTETVCKPHADSAEKTLTGPPTFGVNGSQKPESPSESPVEPPQQPPVQGGAKSGCCGSQISPTATGGACAPLDPQRTRPTAPAGAGIPFQDRTRPGFTGAEDLLKIWPDLDLSYVDDFSKLGAVPVELSSWEEYRTDALLRAINIVQHITVWSFRMWGVKQRWTNEGRKLVYDFFMDNANEYNDIKIDTVMLIITSAWQKIWRQAARNDYWYCYQLEDINSIFKPRQDNGKHMIAGAAKELGIVLNEYKDDYTKKLEALIDTLNLDPKNRVNTVTPEKEADLNQGNERNQEAEEAESSEEEAEVEQEDAEVEQEDAEAEQEEVADT